MTTLTEFLLARIADDERQALQSKADAESGKVHHTVLAAWMLAMSARILAECEAKRRIVESIVEDHGHGDWIVDHHILQWLGTVYAEHPDYRQEWRP